jgi:hypothetical protein
MGLQWLLQYNQCCHECSPTCPCSCAQKCPSDTVLGVNCWVEGSKEFCEADLGGWSFQPPTPTHGG